MIYSNSELQCLASEVKTPHFKKAVCGDDETESDEDICVKYSSTTVTNKQFVKSTHTSLFNSLESLPSPEQNKLGEKPLVLDEKFTSPTKQESHTQQLERTAILRYIAVNDVFNNPSDDKMDV